MAVEIRKTDYKMISKNMRTHDDELVQHLNCQAKQSAIEGSDLDEHERVERSGNRRGSKTQYILLIQSNKIIRIHM